MFKPLVFLLASLGIVYVSRASLRAPRSHGFYRFFAWEFILALVVLNVDSWFRDSFSPLHLISWICLIIALILIVVGLRALRQVGQPDAQHRADEPLLGLEKTTTLVTVGVYRYIRHPLYSSLLFLAWGVFLKDVSPITGFCVAAATAALIATAKVEEAEDVRFFGPAYQAYMKQSKMFIPFLF